MARPRNLSTLLVGMRRTHARARVRRFNKISTTTLRVRKQIARYSFHREKQLNHTMPKRNDGGDTLSSVRFEELKRARRPPSKVGGIANQAKLHCRRKVMWCGRRERHKVVGTDRTAEAQPPCRRNAPALRRWPRYKGGGVLIISFNSASVASPSPQRSKTRRRS